MAALPAMSGHLARQWDLTFTSEPFRHGYNAVVLPVAQGGRPLALKLTWPPGQARGEADALAAWQAGGVVELVAADVPRGARVRDGRAEEPAAGAAAAAAAATTSGAAGAP